MLKKISNIGDCGISCDFGDEVNKKTNKEVIRLFNFIQESVNSKKIKGILNYTPSYNKLIINFELGQTKSKEIIEFINSSDYSKTTLSENLIFTLAFFGASLLSLIAFPSLFITRENPLSRTLLMLEASSNLSNEFNFTSFLFIIF